jgi:hypothetical protein
MKRHWASALFLLAAATGLFAKAVADYDHSVDFGRYHTYSWIAARAEDPLWNDRIANAIDSQLTAKGWRKVGSGGDASVSAFGSTHSIQTFETWYDGFGGGWGWRRGWGGAGFATTTIERTPVGTLVVDIFDSRSKKLIWRGTSSATLSGNPGKNERKLTKDVAGMFKKFPPPEKG